MHGVEILQYEHICKNVKRNQIFSMAYIFILLINGNSFHEL